MEAAIVSKLFIHEQMDIRLLLLTEKNTESKSISLGGEKLPMGVIILWYYFIGT